MAAGKPAGYLKRLGEWLLKPTILVAMLVLTAMILGRAVHIELELPTGLKFKLDFSGSVPAAPANAGSEGSKL